MDFLKKMGIQFVIVHGKLLEPARLQSVLDWDARHGDFNLVGKFGDDFAYRIDK